MPAPKIVFSIPVHENPRVIVDQIRNLQGFVPGAAVVLHLNRRFYLWKKGRLELRSESYLNRVFVPSLTAIPGVYVNDARLPTEWGNIAHVHLSNFRYADRNLDFDTFVLLSSSCMIVRRGAAELMAGYDYGVALQTPAATNEWRVANEGDPTYEAIKRDSGAKAYVAGQVEGTYYGREPFRRIADLIERHFRYTPGHIKVHEEVYFPLVASALGGRNGGSPIVLKENRAKLPPLDPALVDAIRRGDLPDFENAAVPGEREAAIVHKGAHVFGLRPVPRAMDDPLRSYIRSLKD